MAAGGGRVGLLAKRCIDRFQHSPEISVDVVVPKSQDAKAIAFELTIARREARDALWTETAADALSAADLKNAPDLIDSWAALHLEARRC